MHGKPRHRSIDKGWKAASHGAVEKEAAPAFSHKQLRHIVVTELSHHLGIKAEDIRIEDGAEGASPFLFVTYQGQEFRRVMDWAGKPELIVANVVQAVGKREEAVQIRKHGFGHS